MREHSPDLDQRSIPFVRVFSDLPVTDEPGRAIGISGRVKPRNVLEFGHVWCTCRAHSAIRDECHLRIHGSHVRAKKMDYWAKRVSSYFRVFSRENFRFPPLPRGSGDAR